MFRYQYTQRQKAVMYIKADLKNKGISYSEIATRIGSRLSTVEKAFNTLNLSTSLIKKLNKEFGYSVSYMTSYTGPMYINGETPELEVIFPSKVPQPYAPHIKTIDIENIEEGKELAEKLAILFFDFIKKIEAEYYLCSLSVSYKNDEYKIYINKHIYSAWNINENDKKNCSNTIQKEKIEKSQIDINAECHNCGNNEKFVIYPKQNILVCSKCGSQLKSNISSKVITFSYNTSEKND